MIGEFYLPVGEVGGVILLETEATRFARCGQSAETAKLDAAREALERQWQAKMRAACKRKSTDLSRQIYLERESGMKSRDIADLHGLPLWRVHLLISQERKAQ